MYDIKQFCPVPPPYGGITVYVRRLCKQLKKDNFKVGGYYTSECRDPEFTNSKSFSLLDYQKSNKKIWRALKHLTYNYKRLKEFAQYKIIHYHGLENLMLLVLARTLLRKKIIITVHSSMIEDFYKRTSIVNKWAMKLLANEARWTAVSEQARKCMLNLPFKFRMEIPVIPAYIPEERSPQSYLSNDMKYYIESHNKIVSFYGRSFMLNKGIDVYGFRTAIELFACLYKLDPTIGFVFCISEDREKNEIAALFKYANGLNIKDKIFWQIGAIDNIHSLWKKTNVYIRPTSTDGDSLAIREVMDCGAEVVASNVCPRPDGVVIYEWNNLNSLLEKVIYALKLPKRKPEPNYIFYEAIKAIYIKSLNN